MRSGLLLAASVAALTAATTAQATVTGSVGLNLSWGAENEGTHATFFQGGANGQFDFNWMPGWDGEVEVFGSSSNSGHSTWYGKDGDETPLTTAGGAIHAFTNMGGFQFGPYLMLETTAVGDAGYDHSGAGQNFYANFGGEARWEATPDVDVIGQVGGLFHLASPNGGTSCSSLCNAVTANLDVGWFITPEWLLSANGGIASGQGAHPWFGHDVGETGYDYGARLEHQIDGGPFDVYVAYDGNTFGRSGYIQHDNVVTVGLKLFFNGQTLQGERNDAPFTAPHNERMIFQSLSMDDVDY